MVAVAHKQEVEEAPAPASHPFRAAPPSSAV